MMLTLTILRCPDGVPPETRHVAGGEFSVGRDPRNDWVLPDPDRFLSKRHFMLSFSAAGWQIVDTSTNGSYLNHEIEPIRGKPRGLRHGDRILLGSYEIEVSLEGDEAPLYAPAAVHEGGRAASTAYAEDRLPGDPFPPPPQDPLDLAISTPIGLPGQYDPLAISESEFGADPVIEDHAFLEAAYRAPRSSVDLLPQDWDHDGSPPPPEPPPEPAPPQEMPELRAAPAAPPTEAGADADAGITAFLQGAGISLPPGTLLTGGSLGTLHALGSAFRAMVHGLRRVMIARASIKGEFRIEQTMIRASGNNPLKFAADDEDALTALLNVGRRSDLTPEAAVADALLDMRLHEIAMMTAMRDAVRDLLSQYNPQRLMAAGNSHPTDLVPALRKAHAWTRFEAHHKAILAALTDDFDSIFGKAFARSYERVMSEAQAGQGGESRGKVDRFG